MNKAYTEIKEDDKHVSKSLVAAGIESAWLGNASDFFDYVHDYIYGDGLVSQNDTTTGLLDDIEFPALAAAGLSAAVLTVVCIAGCAACCCCPKKKREVPKELTTVYGAQFQPVLHHVSLDVEQKSSESDECVSVVSEVPLVHKPSISESQHDQLARAFESGNAAFQEVSGALLHRQESDSTSIFYDDFEDYDDLPEGSPVMENYH